MSMRYYHRPLSSALPACAATCRAEMAARVSQFSARRMPRLSIRLLLIYYSIITIDKLSIVIIAPRYAVRCEMTA